MSDGFGLLSRENVDVHQKHYNKSNVTIACEFQKVSAGAAGVG